VHQNRAYGKCQNTLLHPDLPQKTAELPRFWTDYLRIECISMHTFFCPQSPLTRKIVSLERHFHPAIRVIHINLRNGIAASNVRRILPLLRDRKGSVRQAG
jgi:hypothetical protein